MDLRDGAERGLEIIGLRLLRVEKLDGEETSRDFKERSVREIVLERGGVEGGAHDDELEVGAVVEDLFNHAENHVGFSAGSYKDMTRVATLNEKMWTELFLLNKDNLAGEIDELISSLSK